MLDVTDLMPVVLLPQTVERYRVLDSVKSTT
jgi:hypothetical protein